LHQLDLLVGERTNLLTVDGERADHVAVFEHRYHDERPSTGKLDCGDAQFIAVVRSRRHVGALKLLFGMQNLAKRSARSGYDSRLAAQVIPIRGGRAVSRGDAIAV